jgi:thiamine-phosphate pyrophosphorylase
MLLFTPELCPAGTEPLAVLERALPHVDLIQVRVKDAATGVSPARSVHDWALRTLELVERRASPALVLVNDRVDVACVLARRGLAGVHLGQDDCPAELARELLGAAALIGLSTHGPGDLARAEDLPVDYLGFGPVYPSTTKGYERGLGPDAAWFAASASSRPVFPIGGIDAASAGDLAPVGRAAVGSAILCAADPAVAAATIRAQLESSD